MLSDETESRLMWKTRSDLQSVSIGEVWTETSHIIKDPVKREYFHFGPVERVILEELNRSITLAQLQQSVYEQFNKRLTPAEIGVYLQRLAADNLISPLRLGDGERLFKQHVSQQRMRVNQKALGLLSIKLPGIYPGSLLSMLRPVCWLLFNPAALILFFLVVGFTILFAIGNYSSLQSKVPSFAALTTPSHLFLMLLGYLCAKIIHEFGHALACKYCGRECSEMGFILLVFMPCLYCDVSDMWTETSRWKRILVSLAGVFVEIGIATLCFWGWFLSVEGGLNYFLFSLMVITSVNTLFVNGNPLMRYDGYYALADLTRISNLSQKASAVFSGYGFGFFTRTNPELPNGSKGFLMAYAVSAFVYRWFIMGVIAWAIWKFFEFRDLRAFGRLAVFFILLISFLPIAMNVFRFFELAWRNGIRVSNCLILLVIVGVVGYCISWIEFNDRITADAQFELADAKLIFSPDDGFFQTQVNCGQSLEKGQVVGNLRVNEHLVLSRIDLKNQIEDNDLRVEFLNRTSRFPDELEVLKKEKASLESRLTQLAKQEKSLKVLAPTSGRFVASNYSQFPQDDYSDISKMEGSAFSSRNQGCYVKRGQMLGYLGDPLIFIGTIQIPEKDVELVRVGQKVRVQSANSGACVEALVKSIGLTSNEMRQAEERNNEAADNTITVEIEMNAATQFRLSGTYRIVIIVGQTTLARRVSRWLRQSFWQ